MVVVALLCLLSTACGDAASDAVEASPVASSRSSEAPTPDGGGGPSPAATSPPSADAAPTPAASPPDPAGAPSAGELAGDPVDGIAPAGVDHSVVGVAFDDTLNVRRGPGVDEPVIAELAPDATGVRPTGRARSLDSGVWFEVVTDGSTGWVNATFLAQVGATDDVTADVVAELGGRRTAASPDALGERVARALGGGEAGVDVVQVAPARGGDVADVVHDVTGLRDDAILGLRVRTFARPATSGSGVELRTVERTLLCRRGVTDAGLCL